MAPRIEDVVGRAKLRGLQLVMLGLPMGVVLFGGVVVLMHALGNGNDAPDDPRVKYLETISWVNQRPHAVARGVETAELGWILEDNAGMRNIVETIGGKAYKRYRLYEKDLT